MPRSYVCFFAVSLLALVSASCLSPGSPSGEVTIYRDTWGIPHIYADSEEAGLYASGWAQAEDRLEQLLTNYLFGLGEVASVLGAGERDRWVRSDFDSRRWDHYGAAKLHYESKLNPALRGHIAAFVAGINAFLVEHPEKVPSWWGDREVDVYMPVAFSRQFIWSWPLGQAASDLAKLDISPDYDVDLRASNEIALAPARTEFGAAALIIDPHLSWLGRHRYWEVRLHAGDIHISGFATSGFPYVNLGHNDHIAWAHTTGGPDTADVYELELDSEDPTRYRYDDEWLELERRELAIDVAGEPEPRTATQFTSVHGPVVAAKNGKAYAVANAYADEVGYLESKYWFMVAEDYEGAKKALEVRQIMPQNVMVADTSGNIYYQRTGRVPIRPEGVDASAPLDGRTSATRWLGIHPASDLMSLLNPERGYMQNCNIGPDVMLVDSPLVPESTRDYLYNQPKLAIHQRGASALARLEGRETWSLGAILDLAVDTSVYQAERWQSALAEAFEAQTPSESERLLVDGIVEWDGRSDADSHGALLYYLFRSALGVVASEEQLARLREKLDDYLELVRGPQAKEQLTEAEQTLLRDAVATAARDGEERMPRGLESVFGDVFRVGRTDASDDVSWPVGGGSLGAEGLATLRSIGFGEHREDGTRWGSRGQTSTAVVALTDPIQSFTQPPIGQSDDPSSPHYRDQAEKLFSRATLKPSWYHRAELEPHIVSETRLTYPGTTP